MSESNWPHKPTVCMMPQCPIITWGTEWTMHACCLRGKGCFTHKVPLYWEAGLLFRECSAPPPLPPVPSVTSGLWRNSKWQQVRTGSRKLQFSLRMPDSISVEKWESSLNNWRFTVEEGLGLVSSTYRRSPNYHSKYQVNADWVNKSCVVSKAWPKIKRAILEE